MVATDRYVKSMLQAALALPGIAIGANAIDSEGVLVDYKNLYYQEQDDLMKVNASYLALGVPVNEKNDLQLTLEYETMSGASPIYFQPDANNTLVQATSGASITDERKAGALRYRHFTDKGVISITPGGSSENDYISRSFTVGYQWDTNSKNTTYSIGSGYASDSVSATNQDLDEDKRGISLFAGVTQVLDTQSLMQVNLSLAKETGYLSDPYKLTYVDGSILQDNRPDKRQQIALLTSYIRNFKEYNGSLHLAYRYFHDDWSIDAHTFELSWNHELSWSWLLTPSVRFYNQDGAEFYSPFFSTTREDGIYSSDYRLASFGSVLTGVKLVKAFSKATLLNVNLEYYVRRGDLKLFGDHSVETKPLSSVAITFGFNYAF